MSLRVALIASLAFLVLSLVLLISDLANFALFAFVLAVSFFGFEMAAINAKNKIRRHLGDMGYSSADAESLLGGIISALKEETKPDPSTKGSQVVPNLLQYYFGWTRFTQRYFVSALETTLYLRGRNKL